MKEPYPKEQSFTKIKKGKQLIQPSPLCDSFISVCAPYLLLLPPAVLPFRCVLQSLSVSGAVLPAPMS